MSAAPARAEPLPDDVAPSSLSSSSPSPLIELRGAGVRFGDMVALAEVDFTLAPGERVMLVGANGSGKTTLLRLLHGQLPHGAGTRRARSARITREDGRRTATTTTTTTTKTTTTTAPHGAGEGDGSTHNKRAVEPTQAMVFQRPFLLRLSVWRNLMIALWLARVPRAERAACALAALERVGLLRERDRPARVLSGGQQQRLALARAWATQPEVLFLDEPTASLDPGAKREVETLIESFARDDGVAIVMSTHNLGQAKRLGTRVVYLNAGRVLVDLPTAMFFHEPLPDAAAQFVRGELPWSELRQPQQAQQPPPPLQRP
jgi:tungstate transport system ATP-binding protein